MYAWSMRSLGADNGLTKPVLLLATTGVVLVVLCVETTESLTTSFGANNGNTTFDAT